jgi:hypothetical protein
VVGGTVVTGVGAQEEKVKIRSAVLNMRTPALKILDNLKLLPNENN